MEPLSALPKHPSMVVVMHVSLGMKAPALSTLVVLGLGIGAVLDKDFGPAACAFVVVALDVVRIKRTALAVKQRVRSYIHCQNPSCGVYLGLRGGSACPVCDWQSGKCTSNAVNQATEDLPTALCAVCYGTGCDLTHGFDCEQCHGDGWVYVYDRAFPPQART